MAGPFFGVGASHLVVLGRWPKSPAAGKLTYRLQGGQPRSSGAGDSPTKAKDGSAKNAAKVRNKKRFFMITFKPCKMAGE